MSEPEILKGVLKSVQIYETTSFHEVGIFVGLSEVNKGQDTMEVLILSMYTMDCKITDLLCDMINDNNMGNT